MHAVRTSVAPRNVDAYKHPAHPHIPAIIVRQNQVLCAIWMDNVVTHVPTGVPMYLKPVKDQMVKMVFPNVAQYKCS